MVPGLGRFGFLAAEFHQSLTYCRAESYPEQHLRTRMNTLGLIFVYIVLDSMFIGLAISIGTRRLPTRATAISHLLQYWLFLLGFQEYYLGFWERIFSMLAGTRSGPAMAMCGGMPSSHHDLYGPLLLLGVWLAKDASTTPPVVFFPSWPVLAIIKMFLLAVVFFPYYNMGVFFSSRFSTYSSANPLFLFARSKLDSILLAKYFYILSWFVRKDYSHHIGFK